MFTRSKRDPVPQSSSPCSFVKLWQAHAVHCPAKLHQLASARAAKKAIPFLIWQAYTALRLKCYGPNAAVIRRCQWCGRRAQWGPERKQDSEVQGNEEWQLGSSRLRTSIKCICCLKVIGTRWHPTTCCASKNILQPVAAWKFGIFKA